MPRRDSLNDKVVKVNDLLKIKSPKNLGFIENNNFIRETLKYFN